MMADNKIVVDIGKRIFQLRTAAGMTQKELGQRCRVQPQTIYKYEKGLVSDIPRATVDVIARVFGVTSAYILGYEDVGAPITRFENVKHIASVKAGYGGLPVEELIEAVPVPSVMLHGYDPEECRMLTVEGSSMYPY